VQEVIYNFKYKKFVLSGSNKNIILSLNIKNHFSS